MQLRNGAFGFAERHGVPMHFDLADLRLFIHIAESPSLTQGARRAFLSPAAA
ncbi:helix-turn-helix domain-containing protein, partial [Pseudomonas aeruginosa]|uniref:helix-turn-helix domain-containing protein n=1 Tax=Pseudomonas aeruginosa TaxID=287 RepID=UPI003D76876E